MKRHLLCLLLAVMLLPALLRAEEIKLSGEMWNRYTLETGKAPGDSTDATLRSNFSLERGYIGIEPKFSETIKGRFTIDIFSTDIIKDGAGLKLKYAYLDFANLLPVPDMNTTIGLQKVYFGTIYDWSYSLIGKDPSDEYKIANSADYGVTLNGYIPGGWGEYAIGAYNGEGYKNYGTNLKDNTDPAFLANLRVTPVGGITIGGSVMTNGNERRFKLADAAANSSYNTQMLYAGVFRAAYGPLDVWAQYIGKQVRYSDAFSAKDYDANAISIFPTLKLKNVIGKDIEVLGRWDRWDETDNNANKNLLTAVTAGINYNFMHDESANPAMQIQLNYTSKSYSADDSAAAYANGLKDTNTIALQFKWRFANTIKL